MDTFVNDQLKAASYGAKKDYYTKPEIHYPQMSTGLVDEWKALQDNHNAQYLSEENKLKNLKKHLQNEYKQDLNQQQFLQQKTKLQEKLQRQKDEEENFRKNKVLEEFQKIKNQESDQLKQYLQQNYKNDINEHA